MCEQRTSRSRIKEQVGGLDSRMNTIQVEKRIPMLVIETRISRLEVGRLLHWATWATMLQVSVDLTASASLHNGSPHRCIQCIRTALFQMSYKSGAYYRTRTDYLTLTKRMLCPVS